MELQRGICIICLDHNNKIIKPSDAQEFINLIPEVISDAFLNRSEFNKIKDSVKICSICCYKLSIISTTKKDVERGALQEVNEGGLECHFCKSDNNLVRVECDWKYFTDRTEGLYDFTEWKFVCICPSCMFYLDTLFNVRSKLVTKYPQLKSNLSPPRRVVSTPKQDKKAVNSTPKRKSLSISPPNPKKRKILKDCFAHLLPLSKNDYHVDPGLKKDARLYRKIAYVNLGGQKSQPSKSISRSDRPKIKIKLIKPKNKKDRIVIISHKNEDRNSGDELNKHGLKKRAYINLSSAKSNSDQSPEDSKKKGRRRHSSSAESKEENEHDQSVDDTPRTTNSKGAQKRRVSLFQEPEKEPEESVEKKPAESVEGDKSETASVDDAVTSEEIDDITDKYFNNGASESLDQNGERNGLSDEAVVNGEEASETQKESESENEDEESAEHTEKRSDDSGEDSEDKPEDTAANASESGDDDQSQDAPEDEPMEKPIDPNFSISELDGKTASENGSDKDSIASAERKKKRVTFSDDIQQ